MDMLRVSQMNASLMFLSAGNLSGQAQEMGLKFVSKT